MNIQKKESSRIFYAFFCVAMRKGVIMSWRKCRNKLFVLGLSALMWGNTFSGAVWASDLEMQNTTVQEQENVMEGELQEKSEIQESGSQDTDESGTKMPESKISESETLETETSKETQESELKQREEVEKAGLEKEEVEKEELKEKFEQDKLLEELEPELVDSGLYEKNQAFHLFSATTSKLEVKWNESFASFDSGLMSASDKMNSSIKYVAATDKNNPDLKGKQRAVYCLQYNKDGPLGDVSWNGSGRIAPSLAYLLYWGCRYIGEQSVWTGYQTGYGWKYDYMATQYAIHIVNNEYSLNTFYSHLLNSSKKESFYKIVKKMTEDAINPVYYNPFEDGWQNFKYSLSDTSVTWSAQSYNGKAGYMTKWISQKLNDGQVNCNEYIQSRKITVDHNATVIWKDSGDSSDFRLWIPLSVYLELQAEGGTITAAVNGTHSAFLSGWNYLSVSNPDDFQKVTLLEGGGRNVGHSAKVTAIVPKKDVKCYIDLQKLDKETGLDKPQKNASLKGAVYEVRNAKNIVADKMVTDENGKATSKALEIGTYTVKEIEASSGYELDTQTYTVTFSNTDVNQTIYRAEVKSQEPVHVPKEVSIELEKEILEKEINFANGEPVFLFEVKGTKVDGTECVYHKAVSFTREYVEKNKNSDGTIRAKVTFEHLMEGVYTAKEIKVMRYVLKDIKEISGGVRKGETIVFDLKQKEKGSAVFVNEKKEWQDWSDDSYCENVIPGKAGDAK